ncbi:MAG: pantoate--beta-alanine ligase [bacterium]
MKIIKSPKEMQAEAKRLRSQGKTIGFVPTMGYLHDGHLSLMRIAKEKCDILVVSIFVNPTQFRPEEDFDTYPRDFEHDEMLLQELGCDILFYPTSEDMYPADYHTYVTVEDIGDVLEGSSRPGFFRGVATIVAKLFIIVQPHFAVFGQKDAQQAVVIKRMVKDLNFDIDILVGPVIREPDGLAMSSRNSYLSPKERRDATILYQALNKAKERIEAGETNPKKIIEEMEVMITKVPSARIDYIAIVNSDTMAAVSTIENKVLIVMAVNIGQTRLIDNMIVNSEKIS